MKIFICYSTRDGLINAERLERIVEALPRSCTVFADLIHNDSLDVQGRIQAEIAKSDLILGLVSPAFRKSPWVRFELSAAQKLRKRVSLIQLAQLETEMPSSIVLDAISLRTMESHSQAFELPLPVA